MENDKHAHTKNSPKTGRGLGHVTHTIFGSTVGYPSDSLASCMMYVSLFDFIFGFLLVGLVFVLCNCHFRAVFSISVSLTCPIACLVVL